MLRKSVAVVTLAVFVLFSTGCLSWGTKEVRTDADYPRPGKRVLSAVKKSGEVIEFSRTATGLIEGDQIVGTPTSVGERTVEIEGPFLLIKKLADGTVTEVTDANGRVWPVRKVLKEEPNRMTVRIADRASGTVSIPLADVWQVKIMRTNGVLTALAILGTMGTALVVALAISIRGH